MTTIDTGPNAADSLAHDASSDSAAVSLLVGAAAWAITTDHKRIGRLYTGVGLLALLATATLGVVLGVERADDGAKLVDADSLLQLFQAYRVGLVFAAIIPIGLGLAIAVVPLQLGARSLAFPRLALTGFYSWLGGLVLTMTALGANGGIGGGDEQAVDLFLAGQGLMIIGLIASAGCVATSVLTTRAPGMTMRRVPLFAWSALISTLGMLLALPVMFGAIIYLFVDHRYGQFNFGGSEGIRTWIGWGYSVPAIIVYALPAIGVAAETLPVAFKHRQVLRGFKFAGIALIGVTALAATTQQFVSAVTIDTDSETFIRGAVPFLIFAGLPLLGLVMSLGLGLLTAQQGLANGRPKIAAPFVFSLFGVLMIAVGIAANFVLGITDLELLGTSFEEGATLFVVYGAALGVIGGLIFWAPKLSGRVIPDKRVFPLALVGVAGATLAGAPMLIAGFLDQPGGLPANDADVSNMLTIGNIDQGVLWNTVSLAGHGLMALTVLSFVLLMLKMLTEADQPVDNNPCGGHTVEWGTSSPAPAQNYDNVVTVASPEPQFDMTYEASVS